MDRELHGLAEPRFSVLARPVVADRIEILVLAVGHRREVHERMQRILE